MERVLIVGAGQAGLQAAASLRQAEFAGSIVLVGAEPSPPYQRPPLSKAYLQGELSAERLSLRPPEFYEKHAIDLRLGATVAALDLDASCARLADGEALRFDALVYATGAPPRRLEAPGATLDGVHYLRTLDDSHRLRAALDACRRVAVVGAGYVGLEVAATARKAGRGVLVVEAADRPLARVVGADVSRFFVDLHVRHGVDFRFGAKVVALEGDRSVRALAFDDGSTAPCDVVLIGIGAAPATKLATSAGLAVTDGVVVDEEARASRAGVWAVGDCANFPSRLYGRRIRLESAPNAIDHAKAAAASIVRKPQVYDPVPWFWSDQYDVKLQTVGLCQGADETVVRRNGSATSCWYFREGRLIAVDCMNDVPAYAAGRRLVAQRATPAPRALADPATDLRTLS